MTTLIRRSHFPRLSDFLEDMWDDRGLSGEQSNITMPAVNITESDKDFKIEVAAPGFEKNDFNINVENNVLTILSEKEIEDQQDGEKMSRHEYRYGAFQRSFTLPTTVDSERINAKYENGILNIHIPKKEEPKGKTPKRIDIS